MFTTDGGYTIYISWIQHRPCLCCHSCSHATHVHSYSDLWLIWTYGYHASCIYQGHLCQGTCTAVLAAVWQGARSYNDNRALYRLVFLNHVRCKGCNSSWGFVDYHSGTSCFAISIPLFFSSILPFLFLLLKDTSWMTHAHTQNPTLTIISR